jgi:spore coat protein U-like protein
VRRKIVRAQRILLVFAMALALLPATTRPAVTATEVSTLSATIVIQSTCQITSPSTLDLGAQGSDTDLPGRVTVQCTYATPYNIRLDEGSSGGPASTRAVTSGVAAVFPNATANLGDTSSTERNLTTFEPVAVEPTFLPATDGATLTLTITY